MLAPMGGSTERQAADVAFEEFFRTHYATVAQLAASIVQDRHLSEDVAQDVMISAQQHWAELADDVHARAWVRTAAVHLALNAVRGTRRREHRNRRSESDATLSVPTPEDVTIDRESSDEIRTALTKLSRRSATVLVLRHSGLSYAEIADAVGAPVGHVGTILRRAEAALRKEVEREARH